MPSTTLPELSADQPLVLEAGGGYVTRRLVPRGYGRDANANTRRDLVICEDSGLIAQGLLLAIDAAVFNDGTVSHRNLSTAQSTNRPSHDKLSLGVYRHHKGHYYQVLGLGTDLRDPTRLVVVYVGLELDGANPGGRLNIRDFGDWDAQVDGQPRFAYKGPTWEGFEYELPKVCDGCGQSFAPGEHIMDTQVTLRTVFNLPALDDLPIVPTVFRVNVHHPGCFVAWCHRHPVMQDVFAH